MKIKIIGGSKYTEEDLMIVEKNYSGRFICEFPSWMSLPMIPKYPMISMHDTSYTHKKDVEWHRHVGYHVYRDALWYGGSEDDIKVIGDNRWIISDSLLHISLSEYRKECIPFMSAESYQIADLCVCDEPFDYSLNVLRLAFETGIEEFKMAVQNMPNALNVHRERLYGLTLPKEIHPYFEILH